MSIKVWSGKALASPSAARWRLLLAVLLLLPGCVSSRPAAPGSLALELQVEFKEVAGVFHPLAHVRFRNAGHEPIGLSPTFGYPSFLWLRIEARDGRAVRYPFDADLFGELPGYRCLAPGEDLRLTIDLARWQILHDGVPAENSFHSFRLGPGAYRLRAEYREARSRMQCRALTEPVFSDWVEMEIPG